MEQSTVNFVMTEHYAWQCTRDGWRRVFTSEDIRLADIQRLAMSTKPE